MCQTEHYKIQNNKVKQTKQSRVVTNTNTENNHPQLKSETRLPKYGEAYQAKHRNPKS